MATTTLDDATIPLIRGRFDGELPWTLHAIGVWATAEETDHEQDWYAAGAG